MTDDEQLGRWEDEGGSCITEKEMIDMTKEKEKKDKDVINCTCIKVMVAE